MKGDKSSYLDDEEDDSAGDESVLVDAPVPGRGGVLQDGVAGAVAGCSGCLEVAHLAIANLGFRLL